MPINNNSDIRSKILVLILILLTSIISFRWQHNLSKHYQADFSAYWSAGRAVNENVSRYSYKPIDSEGIVQKHSMFLNPPIIAHPFRIFGAIPYDQAKTTWYWLQLTLFIISIILLAKSLRERLFFIVTTINGMPFIFWPLYAELERGETNMITLFLVSLSYYAWRKEKIVTSGIALGLGSAFKFPLLLIFFIPFVVKKYKLIAAGVITFIAVFAISLAIDGWEINRTYFVNYLPGIARHDHLPPNVFTKADTASPPSTRWQGKTYTTRQQFHSSSGSAVRFFRSWFEYKIDRGLLVGGVIVTAAMLYASALKKGIPRQSRYKNDRFADIAFSAAIMGTLILHPLSWITNYVVFIAPVIIMWRHANNLWSKKHLRPLITLLALGSLAIIIGDPITYIISPNLPEFIDIILRNRTWLGGTLVWMVLLTLLIVPENIYPVTRKKTN